MKTPLRASTFDGAEHAPGTAEGCPGHPLAPTDVPPGDATLAAGAPSPSPAPDSAQPPYDEIKSWGWAPPSTLEAYLDRWTDYFAADPRWRQILSVLQERCDSSPDPLTHRAFCRRLAAALLPPFVEPYGAPTIQRGVRAAR